MLANWQYVTFLLTDDKLIKIKSVSLRYIFIVAKISTENTNHSFWLIMKFVGVAVNLFSAVGKG